MDGSSSCDSISTYTLGFCVLGFSGGYVCLCIFS